MPSDRYHSKKKKPKPGTSAFGDRAKDRKRRIEHGLPYKDLDKHTDREQMAVRQESEKSKYGFRRGGK